MPTRAPSREAAPRIRLLLLIAAALALWGWLLVGWTAPPEAAPWGHVVTPEQWRRVG